MSNKYIGLVGSLASGKGVVAKFFESTGYLHVSLSDIVREETVRRGLSLTRDNLQNVGDELRLMHGNHVLAERLVDKMSTFDGKIVIDSIRNPGEIAFLRQVLDILIIGVDADVEVRYERYLHRAEERGEDLATLADFQRVDGRDWGVGGDSNGQRVSDCLALADIHIRNNGTVEVLYQQLENTFLHNPDIFREGRYSKK